MTAPKIIVCDGVARSQAGWAREELGCRSYLVNLVNVRIRMLGWPPCKAATMPVKHPTKKALESRRAKIRARRFMKIGNKLINIGLRKEKT